MSVIMAAAQTLVLASAADSDRVIVDLTVPTPCAGQEEGALAEEIVVCAKIDGESPYRIGRTTRAGPAAMPKAEVKLSEGTSLSAETESVDLGMVRSQRALVRLKIKF
jgi:hypothetical protein